VRRVRICVGNVRRQRVLVVFKTHPKNKKERTGLENSVVEKLKENVNDETVQ
jgi:hypothetical protein